MDGSERYQRGGQFCVDRFQTPVTFTNWTGANPDDDMVTEDLDCVEIFYDSTWNDRSCPHLKPFICEN